MSKQSRNKILTATMAASLVASAAYVVEADAAFKDVEKTSHKDAINNLAQQEVISGFGDQTFRPGEKIQRKHAAKIIAEILQLDTKNVKNPNFKDVSTDSNYYGYIAALQNADIINGYEKDQTFRPNAYMTRGQMAKIIANAFELNVDETVETPFTDIAKSQNKKYIEALYKFGITKGIAADRFGVNENVTRGQLASFVVRAENTSTSTEDVNVTIMHTNDAHGNTQKYPKLATAVNEVRAENKDALLVDAGDVFTGTLYFNEFKGQADIALMNYIGYDIMTIGNHEFDLGSSPEGHKAFKEFVEAAKFPFVSSNVDMSKDQLLKGLFSDVISSKPAEGKIYNGMIKEINGEKIGFFGLTTAETKDISSPGSVVFENYIEEANKAVKAFENMGINKIVAVSHIGYQDNSNVDNDVLLASNVEGIDVIVGGHSHDALAEPVVIEKNTKGEEQAPTVIVQSGEYLNNLGKLDVTFDANGEVKAAEGELIDLSKKEDDEKAAEILAPFTEVVQKVENEKIGLTLATALENPRTNADESEKLSVRNDDTILANLITDGMLAKAREVAAKMDKKVVLALQNGGGIRVDIPAGEVTTGQVIKVLPFGNTLALMDVTGAELKAGFEVALKNAPKENGGFLHIAGGIAKYDATKPVGERVVSIEYKDGDKLVAIEADKMYTVATNAYTAKGGDGFDIFGVAYAEGRVTDLGLSDWTNLRDHLLSLKAIPTTVEDRVQSVTGEETPEPEVKTVTIAEARQVGAGKEVQTTGIVTAILNNTIHMEDATGATALYRLSGSVEIGDEITVKGETTEYRGLFQIQNGEIVKRTENKQNVVATKVAGKDVGENTESEFVAVDGVTIVSGGPQNFEAKTADGATFIVRDEKGTLNLEAGKTYDEIAGIVQQFNDDYQIIPRNADDVTLDKTVTRSVKASIGSGLVASGTKVALSSLTENAKIYYTTDGTAPTTASKLYTEAVTIAEASTIKAIAIADGMKVSDVATYTYKTYDATKGLQIHDIQGEGHDTPMNGSAVEGVQGIVTSTYELNGGFYFTAQTPDAKADDNANTSEAIIVYAGNKNPNVAVGSLVAITGTVSEFAIDGGSSKASTDLTVTQINARDDRGGKIEVVEQSVSLPKPIKITNDNLNQLVIDNDSFAKFDPAEDAVDFWESLEGMRVEAGTVNVTAPQAYGEVYAVPEGAKTETKNGGVLLTATNPNPNLINLRFYNNDATKKLAESFAVATGDKFEGPIVGTVNYGYSNYKVVVDYEEMVAKYKKGAAKQDTAAIQQAAGKLTVATYNIENYSANEKHTSNDKAAKIAKGIVEGMGSPDIIGLTEVQDNDGADATDSSAASKSFERLIKDIVAAGGPEYKYVNIDPVYNKDGGAPGANIRPGFLYNPERVQLAEGTAGDATTAINVANGKLSLNPGLIDPTNDAMSSSRKPLVANFLFEGKEVIVIANHWNSKSGDLPLWGKTQPVTLSSETQRIEIAKVVGNFVKEVKAQNPAANVIAVGDFNDFQFSAPLKELEKAGMHNMIHDVPDAERYTYTYQGNSQVLDHILVTENLKAKSIIDIVNVNADFTEAQGRASDHNPVVVQVDFN